MIDIEDYVFTAVARALRAEFPNVYVTGENTAAPPSFPCVCLMETDNAVVERTRDSESIENHAALTYQGECYSNLKTGRKRQCRALAACVDKTMQELGFTRTMLEPMPNVQDPSIYRMTGRWRAAADHKLRIYRI